MKYRKWPGKWSKAEYARTIIETLKAEGKSNNAILSIVTGYMYIGSIEPIIANRIAKHLERMK